jgi:hypothetical protein
MANEWKTKRKMPKKLRWETEPKGCKTFHTYPDGSVWIEESEWSEKRTKENILDLYFPEDWGFVLKHLDMCILDIIDIARRHKQYFAYWRGDADVVDQRMLRASNGLVYEIERVVDIHIYGKQGLPRLITDMGKFAEWLKEGWC